MSNLKEMSHKELINDLFINMMRSYPFYGHIGSMIAKVPVTNESGIMTFAVGKKTGEITLKMWYNTEYMDECIEKVGHEKAYIHFFEVIKHEILHVIFGHLSLNLPDKNRMAVAVDLSVNSYLKKDNFIKQDDGSNACMIPEDFKLEPKQTALYYYQKLIDNKQYNNMMKQDNKDGTIKQAVSSHSHWGEIANDQVSQEILKDLVRKAKETCENNQMWGNTPSELISRIEDLIKFKKPLIPWSRVLKLFTASCSETEIDYTMRKRSKRFGTRPGIKKFEKLKLAIGIDTSGSISNEQLNLFLNELKWIEKEGGYVHIYECDTEIKRDYPFKKYDGNFTGRGGTNLEPVLKRVSEEKYDALIFFTDFYTPKIETNYHIPTLWVLSENNMEKEDFPYLFPGNVYIRIKDDMDGCERV